MAGLSEEQGVARVEDGSWCVSECLDHLATANRQYLEAMAGAAGQGRARGRLRRGPAKPGLVGGWFVSILEPPPRRWARMKAPPKIRPRVAPPLGETFAAFVATQAEARRFLRANADLDLAGIRFPNPFIPGVRFSLATGLHVIPAHERRHLLQAWGVRRAVEAAAADHTLTAGRWLPSCCGSMKAMLPDIEEVLLKPGASVRFEDRDDLLAKLDRLGRPIPGRVHGRTRDHREHYVMLRYLRSLAGGEEELLPLPVTLEKSLEHHDPPDFSLLWPDGRRETFELTDASTEEYQRRLTEADRRGDRDLVFPEGIDIDTSDADAASYWVDIVFASFLRKAQDLEVGGFDVDHLLLYDLTGVGLLMPLQEGVRPLRKRIQQWHAQSRPAHRFARISVLRDTALFLDITGVGRLLQQESPRFQLYVIEARDEEDLARRLREIDRYCREHSIRHLKLFGSVLRDREDGLEEVADPDRFFRPDSDLDLLVEFEPGTEVSLFDMVGMERELGELIGFKVDLRTAGDLSQYFRQQVIDQAKELHAQRG